MQCSEWIFVLCAHRPIEVGCRRLRDDAVPQLHGHAMLPAHPPGFRKGHYRDDMCTCRIDVANTAEALLLHVVHHCLLGACRVDLHADPRAVFTASDHGVVAALRRVRSEELLELLVQGIEDLQQRAIDDCVQVDTGLISFLLKDPCRERHEQRGIESSELEYRVLVRVDRGVRLATLALRKRADDEGSIAADRWERHD